MLQKLGWNTFRFKENIITHLTYIFVAVPLIQTQLLVHKTLVGNTAIERGLFIYDIIYLSPDYFRQDEFSVGETS